MALSCTALSVSPTGALCHLLGGGAIGGIAQQDQVRVLRQQLFLTNFSPRAFHCRADVDPTRLLNQGVNKRAWASGVRLGRIGSVQFIEYLGLAGCGGNFFVNRFNARLQLGYQIGGFFFTSS